MIKRFWIPSKKLGDDKQNDQGKRSHDDKGIFPSKACDQKTGQNGECELPGSGAHLDNAGHFAPVQGKPSGNGGQGNDINRTESYAEDQAKNKVELEQGADLRHKTEPQAKKDGGNAHQNPGTECVIELAYEDTKQPRDKKGQRRGPGKRSSGPAEFIHQRVEKDTIGDIKAHANSLDTETGGRNNPAIGHRFFVQRNCHAGCVSSSILWDRPVNRRFIARFLKIGSRVTVLVEKASMGVSMSMIFSN